MIVVKVGGDVAKDISPSLVSDLRGVLQQEGIVIVHGGGEMVTDVANRLGKEPTFVVSPEGIRSRYTDEEDMRIFVMVMCGVINKGLVSALIRGGIRALGISGADASIMRAKRRTRIVTVDERNRKRAIEGGFTGKIENVDSELLRKMVMMGLVPVISPIAMGEEFELLNVDADMAASKLAVSLVPSKLIFLTDVAGVLDGDKVINLLKLDEAQAMLKRVGFGMNRKLMAAIEAVSAGVEEAVVSSGYIERPLSAVLSHEVGTVICR